MGTGKSCVAGQCARMQSTRLQDLVHSRNIKALKKTLSKTRPPTHLNEALLTAAKYAVKEAIGLLLEHGASPTCLNEDGLNPLMLVLQHCNGDFNLVRLLLKYCQNKAQMQEMIENRNSNNQTVLEYAVAQNQTGAIKELITFELNVNRPIHALVAAAKVQNCKHLAILVYGYCNDIRKDMYSRTPLMYESYYGCKICIKNLLQGGANVNKGDKNGTTPLMFAALASDCHVIDLLLEKGADINAMDLKGRTALLCAVSGNMNRDAATYLLDKGADPNVVNKAGRNAMLIAAGKDDVDVVEKLLEKGCDINCVEPGGNNVISEAVMSGSRRVLEYLLGYFDPKVDSEHPVKPTFDLNKLCISARTLYDNFTPLTGAICMRNDAFVNILLNHGAGINVRDGENCTPLTMALSRCSFLDGSASIVSDLLCFGADPNSMGNSFTSGHVKHNLEVYGSPLEIAILNGQAGFVRMLWAAGCSLGPCNGWRSDTIPWRYQKTAGVKYPWEKKDICSFLKEIQNKPRSLTELSRIKIRQYLKTNVKKNIHSLPLPGVLKEYLNFNEWTSLYTEYRRQACNLKEKTGDDYLCWLRKSNGYVDRHIYNNRHVNCQDDMSTVFMNKWLNQTRWISLLMDEAGPSFPY